MGDDVVSITPTSSDAAKEPTDGYRLDKVDGGSKPHNSVSRRARFSCWTVCRWLEPVCSKWNTHRDLSATRNVTRPCDGLRAVRRTSASRARRGGISPGWRSSG